MPSDLLANYLRDKLGINIYIKQIVVIFPRENHRATAVALCVGRPACTAYMRMQDSRSAGWPSIAPAHAGRSKDLTARSLDSVTQ